MKIALGTDHRGFSLKNYIMQHAMIGEIPITWDDKGAFDDERSDYPVFAQRVCTALLSREVEKGILLCATGVGMAIAANRFAGIYAALVWNADVARLSASDDHANILVLPSDYVSNEYALEIIEAWLTTKFKGGRYQERVAMVDAFSAGK